MIYLTRQLKSGRVSRQAGVLHVGLALLLGSLALLGLANHYVKVTARLKHPAAGQVNMKLGTEGSRVGDDPWCDWQEKDVDILNFTHQEQNARLGREVLLFFDSQWRDVMVIFICS